MWSVELRDTMSLMIIFNIFIKELVDRWSHLISSLFLSLPNGFSLVQNVIYDACTRLFFSRKLQYFDQ